MQGIFQKENTDKALKYGIYRHLPTYEKIIRNLVSFYVKQFLISATVNKKAAQIYLPGSASTVDDEEKISEPVQVWRKKLPAESGVSAFSAEED